MSFSGGLQGSGPPLRPGLAAAADPAATDRLAGAARVAAGLVLAVTALGCGASVSSIYEGDVRFEHCMALDARPAVTPPERRHCWIEWVRYYTYGQTQDRVEYAVAHASGSERAEKESAAAPTLAAPEPTSAFAPPPMTMETGDAGAPAASGKNAPDASAPGRAVDPSCSAECAETRDDCRTSCQGGSCEKSCNGKYTRCLERCGEVRER